MPNWCFTFYTAEGPENQLKKLYKSMTEVAPGLIENDFGAAWLGNLAMALGVNPLKEDRFQCRGEYYDVKLDSPGRLTFSTMTAWAEAVDMRLLIESKFPGVHLFYIAEEFGCDYWITNDLSGKYFPERYFFWSENYGDGGDMYYNSLHDLLQAVTAATGLYGMLTYDECEEALQEFQNGDYAYQLHRICFDTQSISPKFNLR